MPDPDVLVSAPALTTFAARLLEAVRVSTAKARLVAESLVASNLRGVDSHGLQLLPYYLEQMSGATWMRMRMGA
jgi:LDH2 family malate/lactate/ureidoglycolate dehydrogenase